MLCTKCGKVVPKELLAKNRITCKPCFNAFNKRVKEGTKKRLADELDEWLALVKAVPKSYPTLTEQQWMDACRFFDGCARCHSKEIDARGFFIGPAQGGRYCDWNIIPLCERCAGVWDVNRVTFMRIMRRDQEARSHEYRESLFRIVEYLHGRLEKAAHGGENDS